MTTSTIPATAANSVTNRTDAILAQLLTDLARPGTSLIPTLNVMRAFPRYSLSNQLLILAQKPTATWVKGYRAWQAAGYQVRKGEKGIAIWAPTIRRSKGAATTVQPEAVDADAPSPDDETTLSTRPRFRIAYVWDISSCDPIEPAGGDAVPVQLPPSTGTHPLHDVLQSLKRIVTAFGYALVIEPLPPGLYGHTDGKTVTLAAYQDDATTACTLVHELAHALLHFTGTRDPRPDLTTRETEAEGVAYVVCETLGIPTASASVDYIRAYRGTPDTLRESLEHMRSAANRILLALPATSPTPNAS